MFNLFNKKSKISIEEKVENLNKKYKDYLNCYCMLGNSFMVWEGFIHDNNKIYIISKSMNNFSEQNFIEYSWLQFMYDEDFIIKSRKNFITLKENLEKVELKITKKKYEDFINSFVRDFELDYVLEGKIVDKPDERLKNLYLKIKSLQNE